MNAMMDEKPMGYKNRYRLTPAAFMAVSSLSLENLPSPIRMDISKDMGIVKVSSEGIKKKISFDMSKKLTPLLTMRSMSWRIFPIKRTKVRMKRIMKKGSAISRNMYRLIMLFIIIFRSVYYDWSIILERIKILLSRKSSFFISFTGSLSFCRMRMAAQRLIGQ
jgi:hypothetical protein